MTNLNFNNLNNLFKDNDFPAIENDTRGIRFLKLRSMSRKENLEEFSVLNDIDLSNISSKEYLKYIFNLTSLEDNLIDVFILTKYDEERAERVQNEEVLIDQLCRLPTFDWGGSFGNSLEKNIVDNYVKKIQSYSKILEEIEGSLLISLRGYTLNSWYNHWTSIIIEDIFKDHEVILPTVGLVKKIDFFINNIPFDLKVTYFPQELMNEKLKIKGYEKELTKLTNKCSDLGIPTEDGSDIKENITNRKSLLLEYQQEITDYIKLNRNNIRLLKNRSNDLGINFDISKSDIEIKKEIIPKLRNFRNDIKSYITSSKYQKELTQIKIICTDLNISIPDDLSDKALEQHLYTKLLEDHRDQARSFIQTIKEDKRNIVNEAENNPNELKKWLYENQGEARFDASNRFFLILTDEDEIYNSWKLKRSIPFLKEHIHNHLNTVSSRIEDLETEFYWAKDDRTYQCKSDILFLKHSR